MGLSRLGFLSFIFHFFLPLQMVYPHLFHIYIYIMYYIYNFRKNLGKELEGYVNTNEA
jgi:hypothetical protein